MTSNPDSTARKILVIDDEDDIREIAKISLQVLKKWQVLTAKSGEEGLEIAAQAQPDAILLDVLMPGIDGIRTLERLGKTSTTQLIPVIMLTATGVIVSEQKYAELGAKAIINKPFDPGLLGDQISLALHWD